MITFFGFAFGMLLGFIFALAAEVVMTPHRIEERAEIARELVVIETIIKEKRALLKARFICPKCGTDVL